MGIYTKEGTGNGEEETGNGEEETGNGEEETGKTVPFSLFPLPLFDETYHLWKWGSLTPG